MLLSVRVRAAAALGVAAAYALPLAVSLVTYLAHDAYHLREALLPDRARSGEAAAGAFVHEHGEGLHSHDAATDALLSASQRTDDRSDEHEAPSLELAGHLPGHVFSWAAAGADVVKDGRTPTVSRRIAADRPPLPPPRA